MKGKSRKSKTAWRRSLLALAVASCFAGELALANGTNPTVIRGTVTFDTKGNTLGGNTLSITNTPGAIINWQSFSIPSQNITQFIQQSAASAVLNRVTGTTPSTILGQLQSNGRVYLINPNGITIGKGAVIDVAGFVASSLNLSDDDFITGRHRFTAEIPGPATVVNQGEIKTPAGGMVYLVGQNIENHGIIKSPQGEIILAAGKSIELVDAGTPEIRVQITAPDNQALNLGELLATGGRIGMYAGLVRHGGVANANTAVVGANGKIVFQATKDVKLEAGSQTTASGPTAGSIKIEAQTGTAVVAGTVEANATAGRGGSIEVAGQQGVTLDSTGRLSANGVEGGTVALSSSAGPARISGQINADAIAGRGGQVSITAATQASIAAGARATASGTQSGGSVSITANDNVTLEAGGAIQANGATGGLVTLGADQGSVDVHGTVEAAGGESAGGTINVAARSDITLGDASILVVIGRSGGTTRVEAREGSTLASGLIDASGNDGPGGKILLLAPRVGLVRNAFLNASGLTGGGTVLIGGDFHGGNPEIPNAGTTQVGADVRITADAIETGDGGKVSIWADDTVEFHGFIGIGGGAKSGDGGFAEISGRHVTFGGTVNGIAPHGKTGVLLVDPATLTISEANLEGLAVTTTFQADDLIAFTDFGDNEALVPNNISVTFQTLNPGSDITFADFNDTIRTQGTGTITFDSAGQVNLANLTTANQSIQITAVDSIALGSGGTGGVLNAGAGDVTLATTAGAITRSAGVITGNLVTLSAATGIGAAGAINTDAVSLSTTTTGAAAVTNVTEASGLTNLAVSTNDGDVTIAYNAAANTLTYTAAADTLNFAAAGTNVSFTNSTNIVLSGVSTADSLVLNATGAITNDATADVTVANNAAFAGPSIDLNTATAAVALDFGTLTFNSAGAVAISETSATTLSGVSTADSLVLAPAGALTLDGDLDVTGIARLVVPDNIAQNSGHVIAGSLGMRAATGIDVNSATNNVGTLAISNSTSGAVIFEDSNGFDIGQVTLSGAFGTTSGVSNPGRNVTLAAGGVVTQTQPITAAGLELLGAGSFDLSGGSNDIDTIAGSVTGFVSYKDKNDLIVGTVNTVGLAAGGDVTLVTQSIGGIGDLTISELLDTKTAGLGGKITLTNAGQLTINAPINSDGDFVVNGVGSIALNNDIVTTDDLVEFDRDVTLAGTGPERLIDTSQAAGVPTSGSVIFRKSVLGAGKGLRITAPDTGNVEFRDEDLTGVSAGPAGNELTYLTITNANNVIANGSINTTSANPSGNGIEVVAQGTATFNAAVNSPGGKVVLRVNDLDLTGLIDAAANSVQITPATATRAVTLGAAGVGTLQISNTELESIATAGLLTVGDAAQTGQIAVAGLISLTGAGGPTGGLTFLNNTGGIAVNEALTYTKGAGNLTLTGNGGGAVAGAITDGNSASAPVITATDLTLNAATGIGMAASPLDVVVSGGVIANNVAPGTNGVFLRIPSGNLNLASLTNSGNGTASLQATDGSININGAINAGGAVELTANATGATARTLSVNAPINANGKVILRAADDIAIGAQVDSGGGDVYVVAGRATGMNLPGITMADGSAVAPALEAVADTDGGVTFSARIDASNPAGPGGAIVINATESVIQAPAGVGGSAGLNNLGSIPAGPTANNGTLTVRTYNSTPGAAIIDLRHDNNPNGNANGSITLETRFATDASAPAEPAGGYAASNIDYRSYTGVVLSGIGTGADFVAIAATQNIDLNALGIQAKNLTLIANAGDVNVNTQVRDSQINSGNPGGSLNLFASGTVNVNQVAGTNGVTIGRVDPIDAKIDLATGLPTNFEKFDHDLRLVSQGDINIQGSIYLQGDLQLRADASLAEATVVGAAPGYGNGIGSVIIGVPGAFPTVVSAQNIIVGTRDALGRPLPVQNLMLTGGTATPAAGARQSAYVSLEAAGALDIFLTGDVVLKGGTVDANNPVAATTIDNSAVAVIGGSTVNIHGIKDSDNPGIGIPALNSSNITLLGGGAPASGSLGSTATSGLGIARADASAVIVAAQTANIDIGDDFTIAAGIANATGAGAASMAIAGTEIGTQITGNELLNVSARNMFITSGTGNSVSGGNADGFASLASSGAIRIAVTGQGAGQGLVLDGASGSGLFDALGGSLIRVPGSGYPISVSGRIEVLSPAAGAPRQDALVIAGAPLIDESLLAAFLRATEAGREDSFSQDPNLQQRDSKGPAGVCR